MSERINLGKSDPALYQAVISLEKMTADAVASANIPVGFAHLLRLRASQLNQCAFCIRMHTLDALSSGESSDRISVLAAWRETGYFTEKERSSLALVEAITLISDGQVPDAVYQQAAAICQKMKYRLSRACGSHQCLESHCHFQPLSCEGVSMADNSFKPGEQQRLDSQHKGSGNLAFTWPYLPKEPGAPVREDYSPDGTAWLVFFP